MIFALDQHDHVERDGDISEDFSEQIERRRLQQLAKAAVPMEEYPCHTDGQELRHDDGDDREKGNQQDVPATPHGITRRRRRQRECLERQTGKLIFRGYAWIDAQARLLFKLWIVGR